MKNTLFTKKQKLSLPISSLYWEHEIASKDSLNKNNCTSIHYNTTKYEGRPFYKSISKLFDLDKNE